MDEKVNKINSMAIPLIPNPQNPQSNLSPQETLYERNDEQYRMKGSNNHLAQWYNSMQSAFEADMHELRATLQAEFQTTLEKEKELHKEKIAQLNDSLTKAQNQILKLNRQMEWKKGSMRALSDQLINLNHFKLKNFIYFIWKQKWRHLRTLEWKFQWATWYHEKSVQRKVIWGLRNSVVLPWQQAFEKRVRNEAESCIAATSQKYEARLAELTSQLFHLEKVRREEEIRMKNKEEETKKAFLRGLSILNMETMSILKQQSEDLHEPSSNIDHAPTPSFDTDVHVKDIESVYRASTKAISPLCTDALDPSSSSLSPPRCSMDPVMDTSLYQEIQSSLPSPTLATLSPSLQKRILITSSPRKNDTAASSKHPPNMTVPAHVSARGIGRTVYVTRHPPPSILD